MGGYQLVPSCRGFHTTRTLDLLKIKCTMMVSLPTPHVLAAIVLVVVSVIYVVLTKTTFLHRLLVFILHRVLRKSSSQHTTKRLANGTTWRHVIGADVT